MYIELLNIGFANIIVANRIVAIIKLGSLPAKKIIQQARNRHMLITVTHGRRTKSIIITDSGYVFLSSIQPETLQHRLSLKCINEL
ncbi:DUF370 domain-containing protein [Clostridium sp. SHJSY1]|uniref:extracellular matrix/biofilm biosynthesis regulator RemA family protein n=1 Tax=Clostridium sp. SHJSY1 TaxID=2942483 RepID=UPI00287558F7|nr:extracellular matrix/biofilm biosynthesis regulator RemA family protein [Clostridium sp. SHJSY1]MDS0528048.1 DUF370 domain-containing protein [Clostridium sp. SHJSY1]